MTSSKRILVVLGLLAATSSSSALAQGPRGPSHYDDRGGYPGAGHQRRPPPNRHGHGHGPRVIVVQPGPPPPPVVVQPPPAPATPFVLYQSVQVQWGASWYPAQVTQVLHAGAYRIHYEGWSDSWDEVVGLDRIRPLGNPGPFPPPVTPPPPPVYTQNLFVNGGFEQPALAVGTWNVFNTLPGWFVTRGAGIEVQSSVAGTPYEGRQHVELDGHDPTDIAQDVQLVPGATYQFSVAFSARPGTRRQDNQATVFLNDQVLLRLSAEGSQLTDTAWQVFSASFVADRPNGRLTIRYDGIPDSVGAYVDDVRLVRVR